VRQIAARARVNEQLIAYYFGGKAGLYQALTTRWTLIGEQLAGPELPLEEVVVNFFRASLDYPAWTRLLLWQGLADQPADLAGPSQRDPFMQAMVADLRRRQAAGELSPELDPAHVLLALFAAACAPLMLPDIVRRICGSEPYSESFAAQYATLLTRLAQHLATPVHGRRQ
jgi:AcrR family transcriptional regulator